MLLTKKVIDEHIAGKGKDKTRVVCALIFAGFFAAWGLLSVGMGLIKLITGVVEIGYFLGNVMFSLILILPGVIIFVLFLQSKKFAAELTAGDYYLCEDVCVQKQYDAGDAETPDVYKLYFQKYGKARLEAPLVRTRVAAFWPSHIYEDTRVGDKFYLLCSSSGKVRYVFNRKRWELSGEDFQEKEGEYFPRPE